MSTHTNNKLVCQINSHTLNDLYQMYLNKQLEDIEQIVQESRVHELVQFTKDNNLMWHRGSKASFLQTLQVRFAHRKVITGDKFRE